MKTLTYLALVMMLSWSFILHAQSKKEIKKHKISYFAESEINHEDGLDTPRMLNENWYNEKGLLIEFKDWNKEGEVKTWEKYYYNDDESLREKQEFNKKGDYDGKTLYEYNNGLLTKKSYYDKKNRLVKEKVYECQFHQ